MDDFSWISFLREYSEELLADEEVRESLSHDVVASGWLGFPGATEEELAELEQRLGLVLPPSYREFLATSNGWRTTGWDRIRLWSTREVGWLRDVDSQLIDIWTRTEYPEIPDEEHFVYGEEQDTTGIRTEYFADMLVISSHDWANGDQFWLSPRIVSKDSEWEAWHFSSAYPGAARHRSFRELLEYERCFERDGRLGSR